MKSRSVEICCLNAPSFNGMIEFLSFKPQNKCFAFKSDNYFQSQRFQFRGKCDLFIFFPNLKHHDMVRPRRRGLRVYPVFNKSSKKIRIPQVTTSREIHHDVVSIFLIHFKHWLNLVASSFQLPASFLLKAYLLTLELNS